MAFGSCFIGRGQPRERLNLAAKQQVAFAGRSGQQPCCGPVAASGIGVAVAKDVAAENGTEIERRLNQSSGAGQRVCAGGVAAMPGAVAKNYCTVAQPLKQRVLGSSHKASLRSALFTGGCVKSGERKKAPGKKGVSRVMAIAGQKAGHGVH